MLILRQIPNKQELQNPLDQRGNCPVQVIRDLLQCSNRNVHLSPFNVAHVDAVQPASVCERLLGKSFLLTAFSDSLPQLLLSLLHSRDSGSMLGIRPQVITEQVITDQQ